MKLATASIAAVLAGTVYGNFNAMENQLFTLMEGYVKRLIGAPPHVSVDRGIVQMLGVNINLIDQYGCWCYFGNDHGKGRGAAINFIDDFCKSLQRGYDCAILDTIEQTGNDSCVPWDSDYTAGVAMGGVDDPNGIWSMCLLAQQGDINCNTYSCAVEGMFVIQIFNAFAAGRLIDESFRHANGFDPITECEVNHQGIQDRERKCCGDYPRRFPYKPYGGKRDCCGSKVFDSTFNECCPDFKARVTC